MSIGRFLAGVGALIWDETTGKYLLLRRGEHRDFQAGAWECVTGRVDQGESFEQALYREVREEIGAEVHIEFIVATSHFYRGEAKPENELLGIIYGCTLKSDQLVQLREEHSALRWVTPEEVSAEFPPHHWLRRVIQRAETMRTTIPHELRHIFRKEGFNLA